MEAPKKSNKSNKKDLSINNFDFFFIDSFRSIKNIKYLNSHPSNDSIFLFYINLNDDSKVRQKLYLKKEFENKYYFIKIENINQKESKPIGIVFPKEKYNKYQKDNNLNNLLLDSIRKSNLSKEMKNSLKINLKENKYQLKEKTIDSNNKNYFNYSFIIMEKNNKEKDINQKNIKNNKINDKYQNKKINNIKQKLINDNMKNIDTQKNKKNFNTKNNNYNENNIINENIVDLNSPNNFSNFNNSINKDDNLYNNILNDNKNIGNDNFNQNNIIDKDNNNKYYINNNINKIYY